MVDRDGDLGCSLGDQTRRNVMDWDQYFISMVYLVAMKSKDPSTRIGAVIVGPDHEIRSTGFNGLPRGCNDKVSSRLVAPEKYVWFEHGERNSVFNAARMGVATKGCTMYTNGIPCADCARAVIQAGITRVVTSDVWDKKEDSSKWAESCAVAEEMLREAGVVYARFAGEHITQIEALRRGKPFDLTQV
jgi:dCMP deaminase